MKNLILSGLFLFLAIKTLRATESKLVDGHVFFPKCNINSQYFWTQEEADSYQINFPTATVISVNPSSTEILVSTSIAKFKNLSEFKRCVADQNYYLKVLNENRE